MAKVSKCTKPYIVSFNGTYNGYEVGEESRQSADYEGDNINDLAAEVIQDDPKFPMFFVESNTKNHPEIMGYFYDINDKDDEERYPVAIMMSNKYFYY